MANFGTLFIDGESLIDKTGNHAVTSSNAVVSTDQKAFGNSSAYFNGNAYLSIPAGGDWNFGTNDFTIDFWYMNTGAGRASFVFATATPGMTTGWTDWQIAMVHDYADGYWTFYFGGNSKGSPTPPQTYTNRFMHVAITRASGQLRIFFDGQLAVQTSSSEDINSARPLLIGGGPEPHAGFNEVLGYMDNIRVVNGEALWTTNFSLDSYSLFYGTPVPASSIYGGSYRGNIRGKAAEGFVRPTIKQFFTTVPDFEEVPSAVYITPNSENIAQTLTYNTGETNMRALAWDGTNLISAGYSTDTIYIHDGLSMSIKYSIPAPAGYTYSMHFNELTGDLLVADNSTDDLYVLDYATGFIKNQFNLPANDTEAITMDSDGNLVWCGKSSLGDIIVYDGISNSELYRQTVVGTGISGYIGDITWDGKHLIMTSRSANTLFVLDGISNTTLYWYYLPSGAYQACVWCTDKLVTGNDNEKIYIRQN